MAARSHDIDEKSQMSMIDVRTIESQHLGQFTQQCRAGSLNAKHLEDLDEVIGISAFGVHTRNCKNLSKSSSTGIKVPLHAAGILFVSKERSLRRRDKLNIFVQERSIDARHTTRSQGIENVGLEPLQHDIFFNLVILVLRVVLLDHSNTDDLLFCIVITE